tara:strand:+ start:82 stop:360 length:279 start_codon:yes stop_codon:yes gene_type:complete
MSDYSDDNDFDQMEMGQSVNTRPNDSVKYNPGKEKLDTKPVSQKRPATAKTAPVKKNVAFAPGKKPMNNDLSVNTKPTDMVKYNDLPKNVKK